MRTKTVTEFSIIGIACQTSNQNGKSGQDIPELWTKFMSENIHAKIPGKLTEEIYSVYTNYEGDWMQPYTAIVGCKVGDLTDIPAGLTGTVIPAGNYEVFTFRGKMSENFITRAWEKLWAENIDRAYTADFELYGKKAQDPENMEIDIFISVRD